MAQVGQLDRRADIGTKGYVRALTALFLLFCIRVAIQLFQALSPVAVLPPFDAWQSGALPYSFLLVSQAVIIVVCSRIIWRLHMGTVVPSERTGKWLLIVGGVYFGVMCLRLAIGLTVAPDHFWFRAKLPTAFHLVLAGFVLVYGRFHLTSGPQIVPPSSRSVL